MEQRNGHSAPVKKTVVVNAIPPLPFGSLSKETRGFDHGERTGRDGRSVSIS
jgi:hypothetical protein